MERAQRLPMQSSADFGVSRMGHGASAGCSGGHPDGVS
jgi:hypothetical protein